MNKHLIILGLKALLEQVSIESSLKANKNSKYDYNKRIKQINEQINLMKEYTNE